MEEKTAISSLAALAQTQRLRVFRALVVAGHEGLTPGSLSASLGVPPSGLSFHLKELTHAGLVTAEQQGRYQIYRAEFAQMQALLNYLTEHCCQGDSCAVAANTDDVACKAC